MMRMIDAAQPRPVGKLWIRDWLVSEGLVDLEN